MPRHVVFGQPTSSAVNIALAKKAEIVTGSEMPPFFAAKLKANGGNPDHSILARIGGSVTVGGVRIATVTAKQRPGSRLHRRRPGQGSSWRCSSVAPQRFGP